MEKATQKLPATDQQNEKAHSIRLSPTTYDKLTDILSKVNEKKMGRSTKADEVIALALKLVGQEGIRALQEASLSNADRLELDYQKYIRENSFISQDEYLGRLMKGELSAKKA
jgi:hypothetical protein